MAGAPITLNWSDLSTLYPNNPKVVQAFLQLFARVQATGEAVTAGVGATTALADATVLTLSANETLANERILALDPTAFTFTDNGPGNTFALGLLYAIATTSGYRLTLNLDADTNVKLPVSGVIPSSSTGPYANDAAAAAAGVQIGEIYKGPTGSVLWRQV